MLFEICYTMEIMDSTIKKRILLVEDETIIAMAESARLERAGYAVIHATDGEEAVGLILEGSTPVDLILMDINLGPGMDGTEAARAILERREIPILFLSSHTEKDIVERTELLDSYGYVVKSSSFTVLDASIKMAFRLFEAKRALRAERAQAEDSERRMEELIEFLPDATVALDADMRVIVWNKAMEEMTGIPAADMLGKGDYAYTVPFYGVPRPQLMDAILRPGAAPLEQYRNLIDERGSLSAEAFCPALYGGKGAHILVKVSPLHDRLGRLAGAIESIRDITDYKRALEAACVSEESVKRLLAEKETLLKETHHRIKNNMSVILGLLSMQADALPDSDSSARSVLADAAGRVQSMTALYDRLYRGSDYRSLGIGDFLRPLAFGIAELFPMERPVSLSIETEDFIVAEKQLSPLGILLTELITNSMKYAFKGAEAPCISIRARKEGPTITLEYADNGPGLPEGFDPASSKSFGFELVGLLARQLNGTLRVESRPGLGYELRFPALPG